MNLFNYIAILVVFSAIGHADQCRLRPFHLHDQIQGSCPDFADLSPRNESNFAIAAGPFPCGTCLQVAYENRLQHVIVVDSVMSPGIDLHLEPLSKLANSPDPFVLSHGLDGCLAQVVPLEMCSPNATVSVAIPGVGVMPGDQSGGLPDQRPLWQPWMNPQPAFEQAQNQNQIPAAQQFQPIFNYNGNLLQQPNQMQDPNQMPPNFMQQPSYQQQQPSFQQQQPLYQQQQPSWQGYGQGGPQAFQRIQIPQNAPFFLRRKTQIRVYD